MKTLHLIRTLRVSAVVFLVSGAFNLSSARAADRFTDLFGDPVIAKGKNVEVKRSQVDEAFIAYRANLAARGEDLPEEQRVKKETSLLERIILTQIMTSMASESDKTNATTLAKKFLTDARKAAGETDEAFERQLRSLGMTTKQFTDRVNEQSLVETMLERQLNATINISETDIRKFYSENPDRFQQPEMAKGQHIILYTRDPRTGVDLNAEQLKPKKERLQRAVSRAKAGEDFLTLVKEYSEDPGAVEKKGEFQISRINRFPEIEGAAFTLPINAVSDIIVTPNALHILKVTERTPARQIEFEKVQEDIKKFLSHRELEKKLPEYFAKLKKDADLQILDSKYKAVLDSVSADAFDGGLGK